MILNYLASEQLDEAMSVFLCLLFDIPIFILIITIINIVISLSFIDRTFTRYMKMEESFHIRLNATRMCQIDVLIL